MVNSWYLSGTIQAIFCKSFSVIDEWLSPNNYLNLTWRRKRSTDCVLSSRHEDAQEMIKMNESAYHQVNKTHRMGHTKRTLNVLCNVWVGVDQMNHVFDDCLYTFVLLIEHGKCFYHVSRVHLVRAGTSTYRMLNLETFN